MWNADKMSRVVVELAVDCRQGAKVSMKAEVAKFKNWSIKNMSVCKYCFRKCNKSKILSLN